MPVGKTFSANRSKPKKEARLFSIEDDKAAVFPSAGETPPAGESNHNFGRGNRGKANRQAGRSDGNVRRPAVASRSRRPTQRKKGVLPSPEGKPAAAQNMNEGNDGNFNPHNRTKTANIDPQTPKQAAVLNSRADRFAFRRPNAAGHENNSRRTAAKQTAVFPNRNQSDDPKPHATPKNSADGALPAKEAAACEKPVIMLATVIVQLLFVCGWGFFYYFLYRMYTVIIIPGQTYQGNIYAYTIFAAALTVVYSYFFYKFGQMTFAADSRIKPRIVALAGSALCAFIAFLLFAAIYELPVLNDSSYNAFWAAD